MNTLSDGTRIFGGGLCRYGRHRPQTLTSRFVNLGFFRNTGKHYGANLPGGFFRLRAFACFDDLTHPNSTEAAGRTSGVRIPSGVLLTESSANLNDAFDPMLAVTAWRKRWRLALATFLTFSVIALAVVLQIQPKFESEASLYVRLGRESAGLDPTATTAEVAPIYETREQELNSALEVMGSRKLLEAVISIIGEDVILDPTKFSFDEWQQSLQAANWKQLDPSLIHRSDKANEITVEKLYKAVTLEIEQSSNVITVTSVAATPDLAQAISRTMLDAFLAEHVRLNQTHGLEFFEAQVTMLQKQLDEAREKLTARRNELGIMSVQGERARLEDILTALEKQMNIAGPDLEGARASAAVMEREVQEIPVRTQPHDATDTLRKKLHELQQKRAVLLTKYTLEHFRIRDLDTEIELVTSQLNDPTNRNAANPTLRELEVALATNRTRIAQSAATIDELRKEHAAIRVELVRLNNSEAELLSLKDRIDELKAAAVKVTEKREQARILDQLSQERISNVQVVQPATFNPVSMSPSRSLCLAAGVFVAGVAAFMLPAIVEFLFWYLSMLKSPSANAGGPSSEGFIPCGG